MNGLRQMFSMTNGRSPFDVVPRTGDGELRRLLYRALGGEVEHIAELFDPRTAPADALDWLACWFGVALDPLWAEDQRRFFIRHADQLFRMRGTLAGVQIASALYLSLPVSERLLDPDCWDGGKVRIVETFRTRGAGGLAYGDPTATSARCAR